VDVKETKMKTQDIRNMGLALQSVQEKILTQKDKEKALAKAARSAKPKDQVSLKPMPTSLAKKMAKDEGYSGMVSPEKRAEIKKKVDANMDSIRAKGGQAAVDRATDITRVKGYSGPKKAKSEALKGDQHKLDHDKDGDIDAADFKKLRSKKKGEKSEVKPRQEPDTEKGKGDAPMEKTESTRWPVYARIMEKQDRGEHYKSATDAEKMDSKENPGGKKMRKDMKADNPDVDDTESKSHQDAADAGRKGPGMKARSNDNMKGDKAIVNPVKGAVTSGSN
jgi:hypothetical protein